VKTQQTSISADSSLNVLGASSVGLLVTIGVVASLSIYLLPHDVHQSLAKLLYGPYATEQIPTLATQKGAELTHRVGGGLYMLIGTTQVIPSFRRRYLKLHRWLGRLFLLLTMTGGLSGVVLGLTVPYSGLSERIAVLTFGALIVYTGYRAYIHARRREITKHREWVLRSFSIGLGVSTIRLVYMAFIYIAEMPARQALAIAFWIGWILSLMCAELWLRRAHRRGTTAEASP
jgi:uncharacterized membrane protein